eukprot:9490373-Pyramimonas_sp.AAC.4
MPMTTTGPSSSSRRRSAAPPRPPTRPPSCHWRLSLTSAALVLACIGCLLTHATAAHAHHHHGAAHQHVHGGGPPHRDDVHDGSGRRRPLSDLDDEETVDLDEKSVDLTESVVDLQTSGRLLYHRGCRTRDP